MHVLWIAPGFAAHEHDHNCIPTLQMLAREISEQGVDLQILTLGYPFHDKAYLWHGIPVTSGYGFNGKFLRWLNWYRVWRYAQAAQCEKKFDLIHSFWLGPSWLIGQQLRRKWQIPQLCTLMGQDVLPQNKYLRLLKPSHCADLVSLSAYHDLILKKTKGLRSHNIIPWGVDLTEVPRILNEERPIDILGCGAFISLKNWALWLRLVQDMALLKPQLRAELIGDGVDRAVIEDLIRQAGLEHIVRLRGHVPRAQVLESMRKAKVYLHTATFESFGFVLIEAAMQGCKVVSTAVGIGPELTKYAADNQKTLLEMLVEALDAPLEKHPFVPFTMTKTARDYISLYRARMR
jgi:1,2-diacylglycerol 3-alpha-glucosyltransferase